MPPVCAGAPSGRHVTQPVARNCSPAASHAATPGSAAFCRQAAIGRTTEPMPRLVTRGAMDWSELERDQPGLAELGRRRLLDAGVVLTATIRQDGTPRISPVEPFVLDGQLWLSMLWGSRKAADLLRDPRLLGHRVLTSRDRGQGALSRRDGGEGEFKIRGRARAETDPGLERRYAAAVGASLGWSPEPGRSHLFSVVIDEVTFICYDDPTGDQHVARWPPPLEFIR